MKGLGILVSINFLGFQLSGLPPKQENQPITFSVNNLDDFISKICPSTIFMGI
jgi:hypothetical protein